MHCVMGNNACMVLNRPADRVADESQTDTVHTSFPVIRAVLAV